jgi:hypothetical protein
VIGNLSYAFHRRKKAKVEDPLKTTSHSSAPKDISRASPRLVLEKLAMKAHPLPANGKVYSVYEAIIILQDEKIAKQSSRGIICIMTPREAFGFGLDLLIAGALWFDITSMKRVRYVKGVVPTSNPNSTLDTPTENLKCNQSKTLRFLSYIRAVCRARIQSIDESRDLQHR